MQMPSRAEFVQLRRVLPVVAATLLLAAVWFPMWEITMLAVQYPGEPLHLELFAYPHITGDYVEIHRLNKYIGFYYPDPVYWQPNYEVHANAIRVPEWSLGPLAFVAVAAAGLFVAVAPTIEKLKRGLKWQFVGSVTVFTVMVADIQFRLYQAGHTLDPGAPVMGVEEFTPPLLGTYKVANITSHSRFGLGAYMAIVAIALLAVAFYYRDTQYTVYDLPELLSGAVGQLHQRLPGTSNESDAPATLPPGRR